ncbi:MAG: prenyltransferase [Actinomycetota bacterium]|nr:prenyltransferase [Actinomycetota bacterium]
MSELTALTAAEVAATADWIESVQLPNGMIPWFPGGHADPWNHTEAAMALVRAGNRPAAERAYDWLAANQLADGSWCAYYLADGVEEPRRDPNVVAYVATGVWWHFLETKDHALLEAMWPVVDAAFSFVLRMQLASGAFAWSLGPDGVLSEGALLTGSSSILHSLRAAVAIAAELGEERPEWELAAGRAAHAIAHRPSAFLAKDRWAMDWYYPVLSGAVGGDSGRTRIEARWDTFVLEGVGVRCVADQPWVTAAETAECVMALEALGMSERAAQLLGWTRHLRDDEGAYWTGCVHPQCVRYPGGERSTYTAAAVVMADHVVHGSGPTAGLFRGEMLPPVMDFAALSPAGEG